MQSTSKYSLGRVISMMLTACTLVTLRIAFAQQALVEETVLGEMRTERGWGYIATGPTGFQILNVQARGAQFVVALNGRTSEPYDQVSRPIMSPDGMHFAFWARRNAQWFVVADGKEGPPFDYRPQSPLASVDDGRHLAFSPDGSRLAYSAQKGQRWLAVIDGTASPEYPMVLPPVFSPDGRRVAVVVDGLRGPSYEKFITSAPFQPDGTFEYIATRQGITYRVLQSPSGRK